MLLSFTVGFAFQGFYFLLIARYLGPGQYGIFAGSLALVTIFTSLAGLGSGGVMLMNTSRDHERYPRYVGTAIIYTLVSAIPLGAVAVAIGYSSSAALGQVVAVLAVSELVFSSFLDLGLQTYQAHEKLKGTALINVLAGFTRLLVFILTIATVRDQLSAFRWAVLYASTNTALAVAVLVFCFRDFGRPQLCATTIRSVWRTGIFFALGMASRNVYVDSDKFFLTRYDVGGAVTGTYAAGSKIASFAYVPLQAVVYANNTKFFRVGTNGYLALWREIRGLSVAMFAYGIVAACALYFLSDLITPVLGPQYENTASVLQYLCAVPLLQGLNYLFGDALMGVGKQAARSVSQAIVAVFAILANIILIPRLGWQGAALATVFSAASLAALVAGLFFWGLFAERRSPVTAT